MIYCDRQTKSLSVRFALERKGGFTLVELVIVITILGSLGALATAVFMRPYENYERVSNQVKLLMAGESMMHRMEQDFMSAIPNSIRVVRSGSIQAIEMMHAESSGRYRYSTNENDHEALTPGRKDDRFDVLSFRYTAKVKPLNATTRMVVGALDTASLYFAATQNSAGFITPPQLQVRATQLAGSAAERVTLSQRFRFDEIGVGVLRKRFYMMNTMVTYRCDPAANSLYRYTEYEPSAVASASVPENSFSAMVSDQVQGCEIEYKPDATSKYGFLNLSFKFGDQISVKLFKQVRVSHVP